METKSLQDLVSRIFTDDKTREEFKKDPDTVLNRYFISDCEKKAVLSTSTKFGLVTAGSPQFEATLAAVAPWSAPQPAVQ